MKLTATGDSAYAIFSQKNLCGGPSPYLIKYRLRKDTTSAIELNRLHVGIANAFVISGSYIYMAGEQGIIMVNADGSTPTRAGDVNDGSYSDIVANGKLLFLHGNQEIVCYSIAASPVSPRLTSKLAY
jgi:hypothetical protein